ncbi:hypothetical protein D6D02_01248 [Aureobasidium pullulans]|nr:hypothetical protein D6D02_01248 [Aureobasidium pullulans]
MSSAEVPNDIILFHYPFSPFAKRIVWYLKLRNIPYAECIQPLTLPRPDLAELGINYRRIPLLSIGRDIYYDTRLILARLEKSFPATPSYPALSAPQNKGLEALLEKFTVDAGIFSKAAQSLPPDLPVMKDEKFLKDREDFTGTSWTQADRVKGYPEALAHIKHAFDILEALLADGRQWIGGTEKVSLADIHAVWPFAWIADMLPKQAFPKDQHPNTWAWLNRFKKTAKEAEKSGKKTVSLDGQAAIKHIIAASYHDQQTGVDAQDPVKLEEGDLVSLWPTDSGFRHKDQGRLVKLTKDEVVLAIQTRTGGKEIRVHAPRWGFRVVKAKAQL